MSDTSALDFFDRLEAELREAAARPRRARLSPTARAVAVVAVVLAAGALALVPVLLLGGDGEAGRSHDVSPGRDPAPVGTVINRGGERHTVVATGSAPVAGPWQMETYGSTRLADPESGEVYQPAGLRCLGLFLVDPPPLGGAGGGQCGEFPRTPGFSRMQSIPSAAGEPRELLVYGRAPEEASAVVLTGEDGLERRVKPLEGLGPADGDYYLFVVPAGTNGRVNWLDATGEPGSRGLALLPP
jgi:hypothetical protein